jgi:arsenate reductase
MKRVLFVCNHNAGRSQIAEAFFNRDAPADVRAESAGQDPAHAVWPEVIEAMREVGVDLAGRRPKRLLPEMQLHADWAITLACGASCPFVPTVVEDWDVADPEGRTLEEVRLIRDQIELRVHDLLEHRLEAIRLDRTGHQRRLAGLLPGLIERFPDLPDQEIRSCADAVLSEYVDAPVRSFVMAIAERKARECLSAGACAPVA